MDSLPAIFLTSFAVALSGAMMPGPVLAITIAESARNNRLSGLYITLGHGVVELCLIALIVAGFGEILGSPGAVRLMGLAGGTALIIMGGMTVLGASKADYSAGVGTATGSGPAKLMAIGAVTSLSNPYWSLWWATVGLGFLTMSRKLGGAGLAAFYSGHIIADGAWLTLVSVLIASGRWIGGRGIKIILAVCGIFLVGLGGYFIRLGLV